MGERAERIALARQFAVDSTLSKLPLPSRLEALLPQEQRFDALLSRLASEEGVRFIDLSDVLPDPTFCSGYRPSSSCRRHVTGGAASR